jgi:hypothetical protein
MRAVTHIMAMAIGLVGAVIGFIVNALYSFAHVLGRISGITADRSHFFIGTGLSILAVIGALCVAGAPEVGALLMIVATIGFFFIMGWWAIIPAIFLVAASALAIVNREAYHRPPTGIPQT